MKIAILVDNLEHGGVASAAIGFYRAFKKYYDCNIDFIVYKQPTQKTKEQFARQGTNIFVIPSFSKSGYFHYQRNLAKILSADEPYDAIHMHTGQFIWIAAKQAKKLKIKNRVGHAHGSAVCENSLIRSILKNIAALVGRILNKKYCTALFACSDKAGKFNFSSDYVLLPNLVDLENICQEYPVSFRNDFNLSSCDKVLGYLGVFGIDKNTTFLIDIMENFRADNISCIMAGDGPEYENVKTRIQERSLQDKITLLGYRNDGNRLLKFFDVLVAPSYSEGMSLTLLEAQLTGTPCIVSSGIPKTNDLKFGLYYEVADFNPINWKDTIIRALSDKHELTFAQRVEKLQEIGYDENTVAQELYEAYTK